VAGAREGAGAGPGERICAGRPREGPGAGTREGAGERGHAPKARAGGRAREPGSGAARPKLGPAAARGSRGPGADELSGVKQHEPSRGTAADSGIRG
jgi:hypothetical protein